MLWKGGNVRGTSADQEDEIRTCIMTGCITASAGILTATDKPTSHFSIQEWNWSALIYISPLSVSKQLMNRRVHNLATDYCLQQQNKDEPDIWNWKRKKPHTFQFSVLILSQGEKKKFLSCFHEENIHVQCEILIHPHSLIWNQPIALPHKTYLSPLEVW